MSVCSGPMHITSIPRRLPDLMPQLGAACAAGVAFVVLGRICSLDWLQTLGGILMAPLTLLVAAACMGVVLLAPAWPITALADRVPVGLRTAFAVLAVAVVLSWWALWAFIARGALQDH